MVKGYVVHGRVQGVGFRWFTRETAQDLGLDGWVRNLRDGTVEVVASGPDDALGRLEVALETGPRGSQVTKVEKTEISDEVSVPNGFSVIH